MISIVNKFIVISMKSDCSYHLPIVYPNQWESIKMVQLYLTLHILQFYNTMLLFKCKFSHVCCVHCHLNNTLEFFMIHISVRSSDRSKVTQNKINVIKNCAQWGLNSQPLDHQSHALPTELNHYMVVGVNHKGLYKVMCF